MAEIASAYVSLIPSARGFGRSTSSQLNPQMRTAGTAAGAGLGRSMLKAFLAVGVITAVTRFVGDALEESREAQQVGALVASVIKTTGGVANVSAAQVDRLSNSLSKKIAVDGEAIASSQAMLLTFKNVTRAGPGLNNIFGRATRGAYDLATAMKVSADSATKQLGKALNDPIKGLTALTRAGVGFSAGQAERIKGYVAEGNLLRAQKVILNELESQVKGAAESQVTNAQRALIAYNDLKQLVGDSLRPTLDALAGVFADRIAPAITGFITNLQSGKGSAGAFGNVIRNDVMPVIVQWYTYMFTKVIPAIRDALVPAIAKGKVAFNQIRNAIRENKPQLTQLFNAFKKVADFVLTKVIPAQIKLASVAIPILSAAIRMIIAAATFWVNAFNAARNAVNKVQTAITKAAAATKTSAMRILLAFKTLPGQLQRIGGQIIDGLVRGIRAAAGKVAAAVQSIVNSIPKKIRDIMGIGSPSKVTERLGLDIGDGLAKGVADSSDKVGQAAEKMTKKVKEKLAELRETLSTLKQDFASLVDPIKSAFTGDLFSAETAKDFVASLMGTKGQLSGLIAAFKTLIGQGLNPKFLYDLFQSGNAGLILDLAANPELAAQAGGLFGDINQLSTQLGQSVAGATPDGKAITAKIDRTNAKLDKLIDAVEHSAERTGDVVNGAAGAGHRRGKRGGRRAA